MYYCIYCDNEIKEKSVEHIIHSALGSSLKSDKIICKVCNNYFSTKDSGYIDNKFVEQFSTIRNLLNIRGDRGTLPPTIRNIKQYDGETIQLNPGGEVAYVKSKRSMQKDETGKIEFNVSSPNLQKAKEQLEHIKKQYGAKSAKIIKSVLKKSYIKEPIKFNLNLGGEESLKGVLKIIYNFSHYLDRELNITFDEIDWDTIKKLLRYNVPSDRVFASLDYVNKIPIEIPENDLSNYVFIFGSNKQKLIYGYVIIFGHFNFSAVLHDDYHGTDFGYGIKQPVNINKNEFFNRLEDCNFISDVPRNFSIYSELHIKALEEKFNQIIRIYYEKSKEKVISNITSNVLREIFGEEDTESLITEDDIRQLASRIAEEYVRWIYKIDSETPIDLD